MKIFKSTRTRDNYKVSAIVSTYNSEEFIEGCLQDLIGQSLYAKDQLEIIIIDSASEQNEAKIVDQYQKKYPHIVYKRTEKRESLYAAWNRAISIASGNYITNANTDDRHHPQAFDRLAIALDQNPDTMLAYSHCKVTYTPNQMWVDCPGDHVYRYPEYFPPLCLLHYMFGPQPLWRKEVHDHIGMFDSALFAVGDLDFNIRFCLAGLKAIRVPEVLGLFLVTANSITSSFPRQAQEKAQVMSKWRSRKNILSLYVARGIDISTNEAKANVLQDMAIRAMSFSTPWGKKNSSDRDFAFLCITAAVHHNPKSTELLKQLKLIKSTILNPSAGPNIITTRATHKCAAQLSELSTDYKKIYPANIKANNKPTISFFAGKNDHFFFAKPIADHFHSAGYNVRMVFTDDINAKGLDHYLSSSDLAWFEWGNGHLVEASRLPKKCPIICRIHRFEIYDRKMNLINWPNVDAAIFINAMFLNEYKKIYGISIEKYSNVYEIPNPVQFSSTFHERTPGFKVAYVSRFHPDKNPLMALQILAKLVRLDNRYKLYMVGGIQDEQLYHSCLDFVIKEGLQDNFIYEGVIENVEEWLLDKSFILSTSIVESQGMAILEAMRQGIKPVIYSGFSMERTFNSAYLFTCLDDAVKMFISESFDSSKYRHEALSCFDEKRILARIDNIATKYFRKDTLAKIKIPKDHITALNKNLDKIDWNNRSTLYTSVLSEIQFLKEAPTSKISIIVISWRLHPDTIRNFQILEKQRNQNFELIFVDNGSKPGEFDELEPYIDTYVRLNTNSGAYLARNIGSIFANAPILLFLDDDAIPANDFVKAHLEAHNKYEAVAVRGVCRPKTENPLNMLPRHYYLGEKPYPRFGDLEGNTSYKADRFFQAGGWDDNIKFGHGGIDLSYRLLKNDPDMKKQIYSPGPIIFHDYAVDEVHLTQKREKQNQTWQYLRQKHGPDFDLFLSLWDKFKGNDSISLEKNKKQFNDKIISMPSTSHSISDQDLLNLYSHKKYNIILKLFEKDNDNELLAYLASAIHFIQSHPESAHKSAAFIKDEEQRQLRQKTAKLWNELHAPLKNEPRVHLIILCHNREEHVAQALQQLAATDYNNYSVYIADNGSTDRTWEIVQEATKHFPDNIQVHLERFPTNIGRPAGHNWLLTKHDHSKAEYIAIGDDDLVEVPTDWLTRMVQTAKAFPQAAVVGGKALNPGRPNVIHGGIRNILAFETSQLRLTNNQDVLDYGQFDYIDKVDHVIGCLHIYKRDILFKTIGLFDIMFSPCQLVDIDHHLRVKLAGYDIIFNGLIKFRHLRAMGKKAGSDKKLAGNSLGNVIKLLNKHNIEQVNQKLKEQHASRNNWLHDMK